MSAPETVVGWARRMLMRVRPEGRLSRVVIRHAGAGSVRSASVAEVDVNPAEATAEGLASAIYQAARDDAEGLGGLVQRYACSGYFGASAEPGPDRLIVRIHNDEDGPGAAPAGFESEGATPVGIVTQLMRHNESLMRVVVGTIPQIISHHQALLGQAHERIAALEVRETRTRELHEELSDRKHARELEAREQDRVEARDKVLLQKLESVLPVVLSKLGGGPPQLTASRPSPIEAMIFGLFESLDDEKFNDLLKVFSPEQKLVALEIYKQLKFPGGGEPPPQVMINGSGGRPS